MTSYEPAAIPPQQTGPALAGRKCLWYMNRYEVQQWLDEIGVPDIKPQFAKHDMDGQAVMQIDDRFDWGRLDVSVLGPYKRVRHAVIIEQGLCDAYDNYRYGRERLSIEVARFNMALANTSVGKFHVRSEIKKDRPERWTDVKRILRDSKKENRRLGLTDVNAFLKSIGMERYFPLFAEQGVDGNVLLGLEAGDIKDMGVRRIPHYKRIAKAIGFLNTQRDLERELVHALQYVSDQKRRFAAAAEGPHESSQYRGSYGSLASAFKDRGETDAPTGAAAADAPPSYFDSGENVVYVDDGAGASNVNVHNLIYQ